MNANLLPKLSASAHGDGRERGQLRSIIVQAAQRLSDAEWGESGNITGMRVRIPRADLWVNFCSVDYEETAICEIAGSLALEGQLQPLTVTPAVDQRSFAEGGNGGKFLILDGKLRYLAAPFTGLPTLEDLDCVVRAYSDPYAATLASVTMKTAQQPISDEQAGRLLRRLHAVWEEAQKRGIAVGKWSTQQEWSRRFGRSQPTIARWMGIARLPADVQDDVEVGAITEDQAQQLVSAPPSVQRKVAAVVAARNAAGAPMSQQEVRDEVNEQRHGPAQTPGSVLVRPPHQLRLPFLTEKPAVEALRDTLHDARAWLGDTLDQMENPDRQWMALYKAMNQPKILSFIRDVGE